jgi:hypothetical protein
LGGGLCAEHPERQRGIPFPPWIFGPYWTTVKYRYPGLQTDLDGVEVQKC